MTETGGGWGGVSEGLDSGFNRREASSLTRSDVARARSSQLQAYYVIATDYDVITFRRGEDHVV